ncbi:S23 ribosomal protein [Candidatus Sulfotelmatobacter kueseliae]|uniref:S23 ribosomal protein n=1 Tax=Candidatus Sulfotelmatobacter kueseliae TaxID=2042962 RepID=A0A2U3L6R2_9BACT|nr:S23 ribosomal protein [Candidatus Sulfotelmatobacter kueseliae]
MKDFRRLKVWEKAHFLTLDVYKVTARFPREELYGLTSQLRRCSASMGANIAEGCGKEGNREIHRFLQIASGSASELDYHLLLARDLNYLTETDYQRVGKQLLEFRRMLTALLQKVGADRFNASC